MTTAKPAAPRGLGRGLSALLGDVPSVQETQGQRGNGARLVAIDLLGPNPFQPRRQFDETDLRELTESVRANGILQPIVVRPDPRGQGRFQIVAGERRWRSAQRAGLHEVPVVVRDFTDDQSLEVAIVENVQRAGLNSIEEALGYQALIDRFSYTQDKLAENVGKSRSHIANTLRLLHMPQSVQAHLAAGRITAGHARAVAMGADPESIVEQVVARGLSVRDTEALARKSAEAPATARPRRTGGKDSDTQALENDLSEALGLKVEILDRNGAGEVRIRYATLEQLDEICRRLT